MHSQNTPFHVHHHDDEHVQDMNAETAAHDAYIDDMRTNEAGHKAHLMKLLNAFVARNRSFTAADICGEYWWDNFREDEKHSAEYWLWIFIIEMDLPLCPEHEVSYPEPRRYRFTR